MSASYQMDLVAPFAQQLQELNERLIAHWGEKEWRGWGGPMKVFISTILSQRTTYQGQKTAYENLIREFGDFEGIMRGDVQAIEACIRTSTYSEKKAPVIKDALRLIYDHAGDLTLNFLKEMSVDDAMAWLMEIDGVGLKTASCVMMFALKRPAMPVDTHVRRTCARWGLFPEKITAERAYRLINDTMEKDVHTMFNFHVNGFNHGKYICTFSRPKCHKCPLSSTCDHFNRKR